MDMGEKCYNIDMSDDQKITLIAQKVAENVTERHNAHVTKLFDSKFEQMSSKIDQMFRIVEKMIDTKVSPIRADVKAVEVSVKTVENNMNTRIDSIQQTREMKFEQVYKDLLSCQNTHRQETKAIKDDIQSMRLESEETKRELKKVGEKSIDEKKLKSALIVWFASVLGGLAGAVIVGVLVNVISKKVGG